MPDLAEAESLDAARRDFWQVRPDPLAHTAFARTLTIPDSEDEHGRQDPYDPRSHPGQWHFLQALDGKLNGEPLARRFRRFLLLTDAQGGGKSWLLQQIALHGTIELGQAVIWALPTKGLAGDMWNIKLRPAWEGSGLGVYLPTSGPGSRGSSAPRSIRTRRHEKRGGGTLVFMSAGGRGQAGQAGLTAKRLIVDELGDWSKAAFTRIRKRVSRFNDISVEAYGSTLKLDAGDLAQEVYRSGARVTIEYKCPHCGAWTALDWKTWNPTTPSLACLVNACVIHEVDRRTMLATSRAVLADPSSDIFGLLLTALDCPWKSLEWLANEERKALSAIEQPMPNHEPMRTFYHDERVAEYHGDEQKDEDATAPLTHAVLAERSRRTAWSPIGENRDEGGLWSRYWSDWPTPAEFAVAAIDVQHNRLYWSVVDFAADEQTWDQGWGTDYAHAGTETDKPAPFAAGELTATLDRVSDYLSEQLGDRLRLGVIDTGDLAATFADELVEWLRNQSRWRACRGIDTLPRIRPDGDYQARVDGLVCWEKRWRPGLGRYVIGSEASWRTFQAGYRRAPGTKGAAHLPGPLKAGNTFLRHITAKGERKLASGAVVFKEQPGGGRHDYGDARGYATAAGLALLRGDPAPTPDVDTPAAAPSGARRPGGYLSGFGIGKL